MGLCPAAGAVRPNAAASTATACARRPRVRGVPASWRIRGSHGIEGLAELAKRGLDVRPIAGVADGVEAPRRLHKAEDRQLGGGTYSSRNVTQMRLERQR